MKKSNFGALLPIFVFLAFYLGLGLIYEYAMHIEMGFYNIPIIVAFLLAILVACMQNAELTFEDKLELMAQGVGNKNIIIPGADLSTKQKLDDFIDFVNVVQPKLAAEGISLGFHNHSREFMLSDYGQIMHEEMQKRTKLAFEIDTYWAFVAGRDPIEVLEQLKDRVSVIHLKDGTAEGKGFALGEGQAPVAAIRKKAIELGMMMVVESEGLQPTGPDEVGRCMQYLRRLDLADGK